MNITTLKKKLPNTREELLAAIGKLKDFDLFNTQVLVAKYIRPDVSPGGIIITEATRKEDTWQGKVGLILAVGHSAFNDPEAKWFPIGSKIGVHDWVVFRASSGLDMKVNGVDCKLLKDEAVLGRVADPDMIW